MSRPLGFRLLVLLAPSLLATLYGCHLVLGLDSDRTERPAVEAGMPDTSMPGMEAGKDAAAPDTGPPVCKGIKCPAQSCVYQMGESDAGDASPDDGGFSRLLGAGVNCGADGGDYCCESLPIGDGGTFNVNNDIEAGATGKTLVDPVYIDRFEVTVGRFLAFTKTGSGTKERPPTSGSGAHPRLPFSGWQPELYNSNLVPTRLLLEQQLSECGQNDYGTFIDKKNRAMSCVSWYEAFAFCIWDGGRLPTETEWSFAASGGDQQRVYPWSNPSTSTDLDAGQAAYCTDFPDSGAKLILDSKKCNTNPSVLKVGGSSPFGDGRFGHAELGGNTFEWVYDWFRTKPPFPCPDPGGTVPCAAASEPGNSTERVIRGGSWRMPAESMRNDSRLGFPPGYRNGQMGFRCARDVEAK